MRVRLGVWFSLLTVLISLTACTIYPGGVSQNPNYLPLEKGFGILLAEPAQRPQLILSEYFGFKILVTERIVDEWRSNENSTAGSIHLRKDGTVMTVTPSLYTRNGYWYWAGQNVIIITYTQSSLEAIRFDFIDNEFAVVSIVSDGSLTKLIMRKVKQTINVKY